MSADEKRLTAFMFCRGGSKSIPNKNIVEIAGKPLLAFTVECALASKYVSSVVVSTDSQDISEAAKKSGAQVLMRPSDLAQDDSPELEAWRHAIASSGQLPESTFISLPATSPLRAPQDIDNAIECFRAGGCDVVFGISPSARNPYLNMVRINDQKHLELVNPSDHYRRQDTPKVFDITTAVYVAGVDYLQKCDSLMQGNVGYVEIPVERALDIDEPFDLHLARLLLQNPFRQKS